MNLITTKISNNEKIIFLLFSIIISVSIVLFFNLSTGHRIGFDSVLLVLLYSVVIYLSIILVINFNNNNKKNIRESFDGNSYLDDIDNPEDNSENNPDDEYDDDDLNVYSEEEQSRQEEEYRRQEEEHRRQEEEHGRQEEEHRRQEEEHRREEEEHRRQEEEHRREEEEHRRQDEEHGRQRTDYGNQRTGYGRQRTSYSSQRTGYSSQEEELEAGLTEEDYIKPHIKPSTYNRQMDTALVASGGHPININVSYKSSINDSNIAKDDIAVIKDNEVGIKDNEVGIKNSKKPDINNYLLDDGLQPNQYNYLNTPEKNNDLVNYPLFIPPGTYSSERETTPNYSGNDEIYGNNYKNFDRNDREYNANRYRKHHKREEDNNRRRDIENEACPIMINKPWSDFLSGDYKN